MLCHRCPGHFLGQLVQERAYDKELVRLITPKVQDVRDLDPCV